MDKSIRNFVGSGLKVEIIRFGLLLLKNIFSQGWVVASRDVKRESYTVDKLRPNTTYIFLVRAVNDYGVGYPSPVSELVTILGKGKEF